MPNEARIGLVVELQALRKKLEESGDLTGQQAARMVGELNKSLKAAEKAQNAAAKAAKEAKGKIRELGDEYKRAGDAAGKFGQSGAKLAGILGLIDPRLAEVSRLANDLGDAGEVATDASQALGLSLGTVGVAAAAAAAAALPLIGHLVVLQREEAEAAARSEFLARHLGDLTAASRRLDDAQLAAMVSTGKWTTEQAAMEAIANDATRAIDDFRQSQEAEIKVANEAYFAAERRLSQLDALPGFLKVAADYYGGYSSAQAESTRTIRDLEEIERKHQATIESTTSARKAATEAEQKAREAKEAGARATERRRKALQALNDEIERETALGQANLATFAQAGEQQESLEMAARRAIATDAERMAMDRTAAEATAERLLQERLAVATTDSAKEEAHAAHRKALAAIDAQFDAEAAAATAKAQAEADAAAAKALDEAKRQADAARQAGLDMTNAIAGYAQQALTAGADAAGSASDQAAATARSLEEQLAASEEHLTEGQKAELKKRAEAAKQAAIEQFNTSKGLKMAEATAAAGLAVINQLATNPGAFGIAASLAAGAAGAASIAAIAGTQLTLHKGGEVMAPDEVGVTARKNEFMLTPTGRSTLGSDAELNRANAGVSPRSAPTYVITQYQHSRLASRYKDDGIKRNDPVSQAINKRFGAVGME